jgi:hypothetical protein
MAKKRKKVATLSEMDLLREISHKLDMLTGAIAVQGKQPAAQIRILTRLGLSSPEIGALLNMNPGSVRNARMTST